MKVLVACECSGRVRAAFRSLGYDAWSNDIKTAEDGSPYHIQDDALRAIRMEKWDLMIAHPVCKFLANSGAKHLYIGMKKENGPCEHRFEAMEQAAKFYADLWNVNIPFIAIENPIWHSHATMAILQLCPDHPVKRQFIQPWQFGHMETKATGLALKGLPKLKPTNNVYEQMMQLPYKERAKVHYETPGPDREANRSRTYLGIAEAMAEQWGKFVDSQKS